MKKMIISLLACMALTLASFIAWSFYKDILAAFLFMCAIIPSCLFEQGRQEYKESHKSIGE